MSDTLVNRVAESGLITLKPEEWIPEQEVIPFDLHPFLFQGLILVEKDFREKMKQQMWQAFEGKVICLHCSTDAIIPSWAYMLVATFASPYVKEIYFGTVPQYVSHALLHYITQMDIEPYRDQRVILKGCSDEHLIGPEIYVALTSRLRPLVKSLMYGEPCSTVPVYKRATTD